MWSLLALKLNEWYWVLAQDSLIWKDSPVSKNINKSFPTWPNVILTPYNYRFTRLQHNIAIMCGIIIYHSWNVRIVDIDHFLDSHDLLYFCNPFLHNIFLCHNLLYYNLKSLCSHEFATFMQFSYELLYITI